MPHSGAVTETTIRRWPRRPANCSALLAALATILLTAGGCVGPKHHESGILNFGPLNSGIYRGGQPSPAGFDYLRKMGIRTVVSLRGSEWGSRPEVESRGMKFVHIPSSALFIKDEPVLAFLKVAADRDNYPLFVYCYTGVDRTGIVAVAYRTVIEGWTKEAALAEMDQIGYHHWILWLRPYLEQMDVDRFRREVYGPAAAPGAAGRYSCSRLCVPQIACNL